MSDELREFEKYMKEEEQKIIKEVSKDIEETLKEKIQSSIYDNYSPKFYNRTKQLKNRVTIEDTDRNEKLITWGNMKYINNNNDEVGEYISKWVNSGYKHKNWNGGVDYYHQRTGSNYIEETIKEINTKYEDNICQKVDK
ncbi:hypothetical protein [Clostridium sp. KNHs214]|uniref:hypothetical protein n=1 Tax=Clostridium sp. KNHs214 TaxID=1540257 RepID=UPI000555F28E|nr:hypothetical protein [Clostridium sp. KNHs214]